MTGIVFLVVFAGIMLVAFFLARSRAKRDPVRARPRDEIRTRPRSEAGLAEFVALVERETGTRIELPEPTISAARRAATGAPALPGPATPAAEPARRPKPKPHPTGPVRKSSSRRTSAQLAAPESLPSRAPLPPLAPLESMPVLRRRRALPALAALAPFEPHAPLAPRAVRSP